MKDFLKKLFRKMENWLLIEPINSVDRPLLKFADGPVTYSVSEFHRGVLILGAPGEGKTTALRNITTGMMMAGYGGIVLVVKSDIVADVLAVAEATGRSGDVIVLRPGGPHRFNPFSGVKDSAYAAAMLTEISDGIGSKKPDGDDSWKEQRDMFLENLCTVCLHLHDEVTFQKLTDLYRHVPHTLAGLENISFKSSPMGTVYRQAKAGELPRFLEHAVRFLSEDFPAYADRTQASVRSMVIPVFHNFARPSLEAVFDGESTLTMDEVLNHRKILLVDMPATDREGKCANSALQYCFCKAAIKLKRHTDAFLLCDEFQETAGKVLIENLSLFRQYRVSPVLVSQSVTAVELRVGEIACKTITGLVRTVFFFGQGDVDTNEWAEKFIGDEEFWDRSDSNADGKRSYTEKKAIRPKVRRHKFQSLETLRSYCARKGEYWEAKWPVRPPKGDLPLKIPD